MAHLLDVPDQIIDTSEIEVLLREYLAWAVPLFNRQNDLDLDEEAALEAALAGLPECLPPEGCTVLARRGDGTANAIVSKGSGPTRQRSSDFTCAPMCVAMGWGAEWCSG